MKTELKQLACLATALLVAIHCGRISAADKAKTASEEASPVEEAAEDVAVAIEEDSMEKYTVELPYTDTSFKMIPIPGGVYKMGSPEDEADRQEDEGPQHLVEIEPFWMGECEVTWDEYDIFRYNLDTQRRELSGFEPNERDKVADVMTRPTKEYRDMTFGMGHDGYPAICMTQLAAKAYCEWLTELTGEYYRLPTEAEWEYACRAGTTTAYSFGDDPDELEEYAWYYDNSEEQYQKVGQKKPNPWGLYDMHGNVAEWCLDQYKPDFYSTFEGDKPAKSPLAITSTLYPRVVRGGSWDDDPDYLRSASRQKSDPLWKVRDPQLPKSMWYHTDALHVGFRVVRPLRRPNREEIEKNQMMSDPPPELAK